MKANIARGLIAGALVGAAGVSFASTAPEPEAAVEQSYRLRPGQDLAWVSKRYYGTAHWDSMLQRFNGFSSTAPPAATRVRVPASKFHAVVRGDTWAGLAARHWSRPFAADAFARMNQRSLEEPLRIGERVVVPILVPVELARSQTLASIARDLYGDPEFWSLLKSVNQIQEPRKLQPGAQILAPLVLETRAFREPEALVSGPPASASVSPSVLDAAPEPSPERVRELQAGIRAYRQGQYALALKTLESARAEVMTRGTRSQQRRLLRHLGFTYVAQDRRVLACSAFRELETVSPNPEWDPALVSPKILKVVRGCQGL